MHPITPQILPDSTIPAPARENASLSAKRRKDFSVRRGLYRFDDPILGEAARVHKSAGDAGPFLSRYLYELLEFEPEFEDLPTQEERKRRRQAAVRPPETMAPSLLVG